ncbi:TIMELESS-interacting protein-like [Liolophura sinensis]|uniref:TIMELESS-interacting protein-like n=1 Tax=Liolophura sinensis TaxID=3198878 RepID=UPI0031587970
MESVDLQMEDIFEVGEADEDLFTNHTSIPDLPPAVGLGDATDAVPNIENDAVLARLRDLSKGAAKRTVQRVQPKLDAARLTGDRGIGVLPKVFRDVRLKGKGHEAEDVQKVMRYLEHWTHRLFPKMPFDEVLERIEKLGTKREVQTYIKRMRLDIPVENEENAVIDETEDIFNSSNSNQKQTENVGNIGEDEEEVLDELMREEDGQRNQSQLNPLTSLSTHSTCQSTPLASAALGDTSSGGLTAKQLERIEANKRRAQERRQAKLGQKPPGPNVAQVNSFLVDPCPVSNTGSPVLPASPRGSPDKDSSGCLNGDGVTGTERPGSIKADEVAPIDQPGSLKANELTSTDQPGYIKADELASTDQPGYIKADELVSTDQPGCIKADVLVSTDQPGSLCADELTSTDQPGSLKADELASKDQPGSFQG